MRNYKIIPALGFHFLTPLYDFFSNFFGFGDSLRSKIIQKIDLGDGEEILDIGCGTGSLAITLKKFYPNAKIVGVDADPKILTIGKRKAKKENVDIEFINAPAEKLPFSKNTFDIVVSTLTFHHMPKEAKVEAAKEIKRVLKPGGQFVILDFLKEKKGLWRIFSFFEEGEYLKSNQELADIYQEEGFRVSQTLKDFSWGLGILSGKKA